MNELNWFWIGIALAAPPVAGALIAVPIWLLDQPILGNLAGTGIIFGAAVGLIMRERVQLERLAQQCLDQGYMCFPEPSAFARFAIYAFIALFQVMVLFSLSLKVEERRRRRGYDPEWR
jgi:hypothetical protein